MSLFVCPVCGEPLIWDGHVCACANGHSYDISKHGYVNLLMSSKSSSKRHGDDKAMVKARRDFLNADYYKPLVDAAIKIILNVAFQDMRILDAGCGECYYTAAVADALRRRGIAADISGADISKEALIAASKRHSDISLAVASTAKLPVADCSCDMVMSIFAPLNIQEFSRILHPGGMLLRAAPLENHLMGLKEAVYSAPYRNPPFDPGVDGFEIAEFREIKYALYLDDAAAIENLFKMTPYYYKTGRVDQEKLLSVASLSTPVEFALVMYRKT